jgi:uncharacterized membrane protein HdeD (DUF308 family)
MLRGWPLFLAICILVAGAGVLPHPYSTLCVYALATGLGVMYGATYLVARRRSPEVDYSVWSKSWGAPPERRGVKSRGQT